MFLGLTENWDWEAVVPADWGEETVEIREGSAACGPMWAYKEGTVQLVGHENIKCL